MKKKYKIYQRNATIEVQDKGKSWYDHEIMIPLDDVEYNSEADAEKALEQHIKANGGSDEYVILPVYSRK